MVADDHLSHINKMLLTDLAEGTVHVKEKLREIQGVGRSECRKGISSIRRKNMKNSSGLKMIGGHSHILWNCPALQGFWQNIKVKVEKNRLLVAHLIHCTLCSGEYPEM